MSSRVGFDLEQLAIFESVAKTGSFTMAAANLGLAQSSVSQSVKGLESELNEKLFDRTTRHVRLTRSGESLLIYTRAILGLAHRTRRHFAKSSSCGFIRIGVSEDFASVALHRVFRIFKVQFPYIGFMMPSGSNAQIFRAIDESEVDIVLAKRLGGRKVGMLISTEPLVWVGDAKLIDEDQGPIQLVTYPHPSETREMIMSALSSAGRSWTVVAESLGLAGQMAAILGGLGVAAFGKRFVPEGLSLLGPTPGFRSLDISILS